MLSNREYLLPVITTRPGLFVLVGFITGIAAWIVDALIDVYIFEEDISLLSNLVTPEPSEMMMRIVNLFIMTFVGFLASHSINRSNKLNKLLLKYQNELEALVDQRTKELQKKNEELEYLASRDSLTDIYNRRKFIEYAELEFERFKRHKRVFSLLLIDVDNFKVINDTYGHDVGDTVLISLAKLLGEHSRQTDCFARWGGEEFIILTPETDVDNSKELASKFVEIVAKQIFEDINHLTISVGVTTVTENDMDFDDSLKRADTALYEAKNSGKNKYKLR